MVGDYRRRALMVCGATSNAGKSTVTAAICRSWARQGLSVAPFKAQNMSNHAAVTVDGGEVGRAQAMQAEAARVPLERRMNPILLKPSSTTSSHLVVLGEEISTTDATSYGPTAAALKPVVLEALQGLQADYDWVVAEGAGGAAEINLLDRDLVNLPLAHAAGLPAILVVDIDQGGAFAAAHGTVDLLPAHLRERLVGVVFNKFRGDVRLLAGGISELEERNGIPVLGTLPYLDDHNALGAEDSLDIHARPYQPSRSAKPVRIAAIGLPRLANPSDLDPFTIETDVEVRWVTRPDELSNADIIVIPGSRATVADLGWLRANGFDVALQRTEAWIIGICAGYQMLGRRIYDTIESQTGPVDGLGLLDTVTNFEHPKIVRRSYGTVGSHQVFGYQIRYGRPTSQDEPWMHLDGHPEGAMNHHGTIRGSSLHGLFDADEVRTQLLIEVAKVRGRSYRPSETSFATELESHHDHLADWIEASMDMSHLQELASSATSPPEAPGW
ncbi:MAG: adenosylcobyric acid synthase [Acidimicrobiales bacterium]|jgi:adenosylcobyric acid synthase